MSGYIQISDFNQKTVFTEFGIQKCRHWLDIFYVSPCRKPVFRSGVILEGSFCQGWLCFYSKFFWDVEFYSDLTYCTYILIRAILRYIWKYCWLLKCTLHPLPGKEFLLEIILVCVSTECTCVRVFALTGHNSKLILVGQIGRKKVARERL